MVGYYKLDVLEETEYGQLWNKIYLGVNDKKLDIIDSFQWTRFLDSRLKEVSEKEALGVLGKC